MDTSRAGVKGQVLCLFPLLSLPAQPSPEPATSLSLREGGAGGPPGSKDSTSPLSGLPEALQLF